jgi:large subunit ribosomal protein L10
VDRAQKQAFIDSFHSELKDAAVVVVSHYRGLTVGQVETLRKNMRADGASFKVVKNRLAKRAMEGTPYSNIADLMEGPAAVAMSSDPIAAARVAHKFAKENEKLIIVGGAMGDKKLSKQEVVALATLPSLDELRAKLLGLLQAPAQRLATYSQEPAAKLARVLAERSKQAA